MIAGHVGPPNQKLPMMQKIPNEEVEWCIYLPIRILNGWRIDRRRTITPTSDLLGGASRLTRLLSMTATRQVTRLELLLQSSQHPGGPNFLDTDWLTHPCVEHWFFETDHATLCRAVSLATFVPMPKWDEITRWYGNRPIYRLNLIHRQIYHVT